MWFSRFAVSTAPEETFENGWDRYWASWISCLGHINLTWFHLPSNSLLCEFGQCSCLKSSLPTTRFFPPCTAQLKRKGPSSFRGHISDLINTVRAPLICSLNSFYNCNYTIIIIIIIILQMLIYYLSARPEVYGGRDMSLTCSPTIWLSLIWRYSVCIIWMHEWKKNEYQGLCFLYLYVAASSGYKE